MTLAIITGVLGVLTILIGGVCTLLLVSTKTLRDSRDDQEKRITFLEAQRLRDEATIARQTEELRVWQSAVTGDAKLEAILELLSSHHESSEAGIRGLQRTLVHLDGTMSKIDSRVERYLRSDPDNVRQHREGA